MMAHSNLRRPEFDPRCEFVTLRELKVSGVTVPAGEPFDKTLVDLRRLKLLYEGRSLAYAEGSFPAKPARKPLAIGPTDLFNPGKAGHSLNGGAKPSTRTRVQSKRSTPRAKSRRAA